MESLKERPDIEIFLQDVAQEQGLSDYVITDVTPNKKGEGNMGVIYIVTVKDKTSENKLDLIIKTAFTNLRTRTDIPIEKAFINEIYFYNEIYPTFQKLERDCGISQQTNFFPKCYKTSDKVKKELLILENLQAANFEVFDKFLDLDEEHMRLIFKAYGRFHAYSFALQDKKPEEYRQIVSKVHNIYMEFLENPNGGIKDYLRDCSRVTESFLKRDEDQMLREKYEKYQQYGIVEQIVEVVEAECDYSVILHGDCHSNNMMFKYQQVGDKKKPIDIRLLDMQVVKMGSPVCDLSYCLYSGASKKDLDKLDEYLRIYYESFASFLKEFGCDPEKLFPFRALKEHWKKYARFGMIMAYGMLKLKSTKKEIAEEDETVGETVGEEEFKRRMKELLQHMLEVDAL